MKKYKNYMDNIVVSKTLHESIMNGIDQKSKYFPLMWKKYAMTFACLALAIVGVFTMPSILGSGTLKNDVLEFHQASSQNIARIMIPGHFWQELTNEELNQLFPDLQDTHSVSATANFQNDKNGVSVFNIDARIISSTGIETYIQVAPGQVAIDYVFNGEMKDSMISNTAVQAGYYEMDPLDAANNHIIYFASFKKTGIAYYVELTGEVANKEMLQKEVTQLVGSILEASTPDLTKIIPSQAE